MMVREVSAKTGENLDKAIREFTLKIVKKKMDLI
jgi:ribosomal protein S21